MPPVAVLEELAGVLLAGQRHRHRPRHPGRECAQHEHALVLFRDAVHDLAGEVGEHRLGRGGAVVGPFGGAGRVLAHEDEARGPAVGTLVDGVERVARELPLRPEQARGLVAREAKLRRPDADDRLVRHQAGELGRRLGAADDDHVHADRDLLEPGRERRPELARPGRFVEVVEHERSAGGHAREELAEPAAREAVEVAAVLVGEERERPRLLPAEAASREAEVVEERRRIGVARVDVVPDRGELARLEVARDEHRLAGAGRAREPHDRMLPPLVEEPEQALARADAVDAGTRELRELGCGWHWVA